MKNAKTVFAMLGMVGAMVLIAYFLISWFVTDYQANLDEKWKKYTTPLPQEVISDLCNNLALTDEPICKKTQDIYAPDFFPVISSVFDQEGITYLQVQQKLGKYQVELESASITQDGKPYFVSKYDLRGDGQTSIAFFFYGTTNKSQLMKIMFHYSRSDF